MGHISFQLPSLYDEAFEAQELDVLDETDGDDSCLSNTISLAELWSSPHAPLDRDVPHRAARVKLMLDNAPAWGVCAPHDNVASLQHG